LAVALTIFYAIGGVMAKRIDLNEAALRNMYWGEGKTTTQIAKRMGVSDGCVLGNFKRYGIKTKGRKEKYRKQEQVELVENGLWKCWRCNEIKRSSEFVPIQRYWMGHDYICRECSTKRRMEWREKNPWKNRASYINSRVGKNFVTGKILEKIYNKYDGKCYYCDKKLNHNGGYHGLQFEHVVNGLNRTDNLVPSCHRCNTIKKDATARELMQIAERIIAFDNHYA